jgi:5-methylcytosine-specific restriction endonuclease McrA
VVWKTTKVGPSLATGSEIMPARRRKNKGGGVMMQTLVVNFTYEPVQVVGWQKAIYLLVTEKADLLVGYDKLIRSVSMSMILPRVVRLRRYVRMKLRDRGIYRKMDVFERDGWICQYCGIEVHQKTATLDHVVPRSKGGKTTFENTVTACGTCNSKKADKALIDSGLRLRTEPKKPANGRMLRDNLQKAYDDYLTGVMNA